MDKNNKEKHNPFEGERYKNYDDKFMKDFCFKGRAELFCANCKKKINYENSYYGYNRLLCKECYSKLDNSNHNAVSKMVKRI